MVAGLRREGKGPPNAKAICVPLPLVWFGHGARLQPVSSGDGSCIFAHVWSGPDVPVSGCTALAERDLRRMLEWLTPDAAAWVALPQAEYGALRSEWGLP